MYSKLIRLENILDAWYEFRKGKQNKADVLLFERYLEDNLFQLQDELSTKTYQHQGYETFHIYDPKFRIINKATVRDRIVHHLLFRFLEPILQPTFIHHSYSCQRGKGVHVAVGAVDRALRKASKNHNQTVWSLKMDIKKFFASVDHEILLQLLINKLGDTEVMWLVEKVIRSFSTPGMSGKGMPIGNLTSQIFANVYLSELDYFVKHHLREHYYFRYADDFLFLHADVAHLKEIENTVAPFVENRLGLTAHPGKIVYRKFSQGIDWLGYVLLPRYRVIRAKTKHRMFAKVRRKTDEFNRGIGDDYRLDQTVQSYLGILGHCQGYKIEEELKNEVWINKAH